MPCSISRRTRSKSAAVSCGDREAVGSSMTRIRASMDRALAISTVCCCATESRLTSLPGRHPTVDAQLCQELSGGRRHRPAVDDRPAHRFAAEEDVLRDRPLRQEVELLVDDADAGSLGILRVAEAHLLARPRESCRRRARALRRGSSSASTCPPRSRPAPRGPRRRADPGRPRGAPGRRRTTC